MLFFARYFRGDRRDIGLGWLTLFGMIAAHSLLETARDALFLARVAASQLPWVYLAIAAMTIIVSGWQTRMGSRLRGRRILSLTLWCGAVITAFFHVVVDIGGKPVFFLLYVWSGFLITLCLGEYWLLISDRFYVSQAKRAFAVIGTGGLVGAMTGSSLSILLASWLGPKGMLLAAALIFAASGFVPLFFSTADSSGERSPGDDPHQGILADLGIFKTFPYLRGLLLLVFAAAVATTLGDLVFKSNIAEHVSKDSLGSFLGAYYTVLNIAGFLVQTFLAATVMRRVGVNGSLAILPVLFAVTSPLLLSGALVPALILKAFDGTFRHSLYRTSQELLFVPLGPVIRARTKSYIDGLGARGGQGAASVIALGLSLSGLGAYSLVTALVVAAAGWLFCALRLRKHYVQLFRQQLRDGLAESTGQFREIDLRSLETLLTALNSPDDAQVVHALDLLEQTGREGIIPSFILYHPSTTIVLRALQILSHSGRTDFWPIAQSLLASTHPAIRATAVWAYSAKCPAPQPELIAKLLEDPDAETRAQALVALFQRGQITCEEFEAKLAPLLSFGLSGKVAFVRALRIQGVASLDEKWAPLSKGNESELHVEIARLLKQRPDPKHFPLLLSWLADRRTRADARQAILAMGEVAYDLLVSALGEEGVGSAVRRHIPRTLSRFLRDDLADVLLRRLAVERDPVVAFKLLRGIGRLVTQSPELRLDTGLIDRLVDSGLKRAARLASWHVFLRREGLASGVAGTALLGVLEGLVAGESERVFRLLGLRFPLEDFRRIYRGLFSADEKTKASSVELLEHLVKEPVRGILLALSSELPLAERAMRIPAAYAGRCVSVEVTLSGLLEDADEGIQILAAQAIAERGLEGLQPAIAALAGRVSGTVRDELETALSILERVKNGATSYAS